MWVVRCGDLSDSMHSDTTSSWGAQAAGLLFRAARPNPVRRAEEGNGSFCRLAVEIPDHFGGPPKWTAGPAVLPSEVGSPYRRNGGGSAAFMPQSVHLQSTVTHISNTLKQSSS